MNFKIAHTCIRVFDLEKSLAFYKDGLGLKVTRVKDYPGDFSLTYLSDEAGQYEIELTFNYDPEKPYEIGNGFSHIAFHVEDLEGARDSLMEKGYEVTKLMGLKGSVPNYFFVTDPDGYDVEIIRAK